MPDIDKRSDFNFTVGISDLHRVAYEKAAREGDLAALKKVLLSACAPDQTRLVEEFLPAELVQTN